MNTTITYIYKKDNMTETIKLTSYRPNCSLMMFLANFYVFAYSIDFFISRNRDCTKQRINTQARNTIQINEMTKNTQLTICWSYYPLETINRKKLSTSKFWSSAANHNICHYYCESQLVEGNLIFWGMVDYRVIYLDLAF